MSINPLSYNVGDVVWAKTREYQWWPACISKIDTIKMRTAIINFIGTGNSSAVSFKKVKPFCEDLSMFSNAPDHIIESAQRIISRISTYEEEMRRLETNILNSSVSQVASTNGGKPELIERIPGCLMRLLEKDKSGKIQDADLDEAANWIQKIILEEIPVSELSETRIGRVLTKFYAIIKTRSSLKSLAYLAECALKKLQLIAFDIIFSGVSTYQKTEPFSIKRKKYEEPFEIPGISEKLANSSEKNKEILPTLPDDRVSVIVASPNEKQSDHDSVIIQGEEEDVKLNSTAKVDEKAYSTYSVSSKDEVQLNTGKENQSGVLVKTRKKKRKPKIAFKRISNKCEAQNKRGRPLGKSPGLLPKSIIAQSKKMKEDIELHKAEIEQCKDPELRIDVYRTFRNVLDSKINLGQKQADYLATELERMVRRLDKTMGQKYMQIVEKVATQINSFDTLKSEQEILKAINSIFTNE